MRKSNFLIMTTVVCLTTSMITAASIEDKGIVAKDSSTDNVALLCLETVFPSVSRGAGIDSRDKIIVATADTNPLDYIDGSSNGIKKVASDIPKGAQAPKVADSNNPEVLIYHTHATESYRPVDFGNFHTVEEYATVRDVGDFFAYELDKLGVGIVHDRTLHDSPSYNQSYDRSLQTAKGMLSKFPQAKIIIDLHRDASPHEGGGKTVKIDGKDVATYALVVGNGNGNVAALKAFAEKVNAKAESMYPGFGGRIIPKDHKYNQYINDKSLLIEVGNNQNSIEETRLTGKYLANVISEVLKEM